MFTLRYIKKPYIYFCIILAVIFTNWNTDAAATNKWGFAQDIMPALEQHGNVVFGNSLYFLIDKKACNGQALFLRMMVTSYLGDALLKAKGRIITASFSTQSEGTEVVHTREVKIETVFDASLAFGLNDPTLSGFMVIAVLDEAKHKGVWSLAELDQISQRPETWFELNFSDSELFDLQHESWSMSGMKNAIKKASEYCLTHYGRLYTGELSNGKAHGWGTATYRDGSQFVGEFSNGLRARGTVNYADGRRYIGSFENNSPHGTGTYYSKDGSQFVGK